MELILSNPCLTHIRKLSPKKKRMTVYLQKSNYAKETIRNARRENGDGVMRAKEKGCV